MRTVVKSRIKKSVPVEAITEKSLTTTDWTLLDIAPNDVKLSLDNTAVVTRTLVCSPIDLLLAVANPLNLSAADAVGGLLGPVLYHPSAHNVGRFGELRQTVSHSLTSSAVIPQ